MNTSIFLAKLLGPPLLIVGIGILINRDYYLALTRQFVGSPPLMYLGAVVGMVGGLAIVLVHNVWAADWRVLITLLGWLMLIRGAVRVLAPETIMGFAAKVIRNKQFIPVAGVVTGVLGLVLCYFGYAA